ncbi:MAG: hypothetical protein U0074_20010 [Kouleothrix sp.]|jgi:hypothetical protein
MIQYISWYQDISEEETSHHTLQHPSLDDIFDRLDALDADEYPSLTLALDEMGEHFPQLFIFGGSSGYAVSLSQGDQYGKCAFVLTTYIHPEKRALPASMYRCIGRTYPGIEIEERFFTQDVHLIRTIIAHFSATGHWKSDVPFIVEANDH